MSFKLFVYYCALCGGWAGLMSWAFSLAVSGIEDDRVRYMLVAALLGFFVAAAISAVDALLNDKLLPGLMRVGIAVSLSFIGSMIVGLIGQVIYRKLFQAMGEHPTAFTL